MKQRKGCEEQARIIGMSGERELALRGKIGILEKEVAQWRGRATTLEGDKQRLIGKIESLEKYVAHLERINKLPSQSDNRYEKVRKMSPRQFDKVWGKALKTGTRFDALVDEFKFGDERSLKYEPVTTSSKDF